jgi:hypothetical protein
MADGNDHQKSNETMLTAIVTSIIIGALTWLGTFTYAALDSLRKEQLKEAELEIGNLYGPLCGLVSVHRAVSEELIPTESDENRRIGAELLLVPVDVQIEQTILKSAISIGDNNIRRIVHDLLVHTEDSKLWKAEQDKIEQDERNSQNKTREITNDTRENLAKLKFHFWLIKILQHLEKS